MKTATTMLDNVPPLLKQEEKGKSFVVVNVATAALGALFAVVTYVIGQTMQRVVIEPIQEQRRTVGRILNAAILYRDPDKLPGAYPPTAEDVATAAKTMRQLAADLVATMRLIPSTGR